MDWIQMRWRGGVAVRLVLGALWGWSSWVHLRDPHAFLRAVKGYDITPDWLSKAIAYGMPMVGLCLAALLIIGLLIRYVAAVAGVLHVAVLFAVLQAWIRGLNNSSGFLGGAGLTDSPRYPLVALLTLAMVAGSAYLVVWPASPLSVDARLARSAVVPDASARARRNPRAMQRHQAQADRRRAQVRNEQLFLGGSVAVLVALVGVVAMAVQAQRATEGVSTTAARATVADGVVWGSSSAPVTVDLYEDFECTQCEQFQQATAADLQELVSAGKLRVRFHPIAYIDVGTQGLSSRTANSALCASDISADVFVRFHNAAFGVGANGTADMTTPTPAPTETAAAPETTAATETTAGTETPAATDGASASAESEPSNANTVAPGTTLNDELVALGTTAGINDAAFTSCSNGNTHRDLVEAITDSAMQRGVSGAPTVFVNGSRMSFSDAADLRTKLLASVNEKADDAVTSGTVLQPYTPPATASATPTPAAS